jgi:alkylation response protein AidB-like acyl-CoA dehydrogenase
MYRRARTVNCMTSTTIAAPQTTPLPIRDPDKSDVHWAGPPASSRWLQMATESMTNLTESSSERDRTGEFVTAEFELLRSRGFVSMLVPSELGGGGASISETCAALAILARGCPATSLALSMHSHPVAAAVWRHRRGLPAPVLAKVAADQLVLITTGGSDWLSSNGTATKVENGYRVTARKTPASACAAGHLLVTSGRMETADGPQVVHMTVPLSSPGIHIEETWNTMGMRGTGSHTVVLNDVFVSDTAVSLVRPADVFHPVWSTVLGVALPIIMSSYVGVAEEAAARALTIATQRSNRPGIASVVGRMFTRLTVARDAVRAMINATDDMAFDNTLEHAMGSLTRKAIATEAVLDTVRLAMEVGGGLAYSVDSGIERLFRDAHGALYHPLPPTQQELFVGRASLGFDPVN